jgi:hypothetical protein
MIHKQPRNIVFILPPSHSPVTQPEGPKMQDASHKIPNPLVCSVKDMRAMLGGIGTTKAADLIRTGAVESVRIGARRMVKLESIRALVEKGGAL